MSLARRLTPVLGAVIIVGVIACAGEGTEPEDGNGNGRDEISFSDHVQPIFNQSCAFSGCHGTQNTQPPGKPMVLVSGRAYANIVAVSSLQLPSMDRIEPDQPDDSYLIHKIEGTQVGVGGTGQRMPLSGCCLSQAQIDTIRAWVEAGAPNN